MERKLEYWAPGATEARPISVRFGLPEPHPEYEWASSITIEGFPEEPHYSRLMYGADPVGAMAAALSIAPYLLGTCGARGGRLTWQGHEELGFPYMLSQPQQDWQLTPADGGEPRKLSVRIGHPERFGDAWSVLVTCIDCKTWERVERRHQADTWPQAMERAAAAVPDVLREHVGKLGGGTLEEVEDAPACRI